MYVDPFNVYIFCMRTCMYILVAMVAYTVPPFACVNFQVRDTKNVPPMTPTQSFPPPPMLGGTPPPPGPMYPPPPPGVSSSTCLKD